MAHGAWTSRRSWAGFTLVEVLVVLIIIGIASAIVLPSMVGMFTAGAPAQAGNVLTGQLAAARAVAIQEQTIAGVHIQPADNSPIARSSRYAGASFTAVIRQDPNNPNFFILAEGYFPRQLPGSMAAGQITAPFVDANYVYDANWLVQVPADRLPRFTSLTILFGPNGQLLSRQVEFDRNDSIFYADDPNYLPKASPAYLWDPNVANDPNCWRSVSGAVLYDRDKFNATMPAGRAQFLVDYGEILAVAPYTGAVLSR